MNAALTTSLSSSKSDASRKRLCSSFQGYLRPLSVNVVYPLATIKEGKGWKGRNVGILTHGNTQQTNSYLHARDDIESFQNPGLNQPVVRAPGEAEAEHVLEDKEAGECFNSDIASESLALEDRKDGNNAR